MTPRLASMRVPYSRLPPPPHYSRWPLPVFTTRRLIAICAALLFVSFLVFSLSSEDQQAIAPTRQRFSLDEMRSFALRKSLSTDYKPGYYTRAATSFERMLVDPESRFDIAGHDVLVFVHIQKTAGTSFEKYLVHHLDVDRPCECTKIKKRCTCKRPGGVNETWLFSRYSTGWVCGLHADLTELSVSACVDTVLNKKEGAQARRRYFYTTFLREPITRFISEYRHVSRGATWSASRHMCNGRPPTPSELPLCFDPRIGWEGVSLEEFTGCPFNLAFNRMTRMLADLTLVDCYDTTKMDRGKRESIMLESAKANLRSLSFFGLKERMDDSQWVFERLFGLRFTKRLSVWSKSKSNDTVVSPALMRRIQELNHLDIQLYAYAVKLFDERMFRMKHDGLPATVLTPTFPPASQFAIGEGERGEEEEEEGRRSGDSNEEEDDDSDRY